MTMHLVAAIILACPQAHDPKPVNCNPATLEYLYQLAQTMEQPRQQPDDAIQQELRRLQRDLQRLFIPPENPTPPLGGLLALAGSHCRELANAAIALWKDGWAMDAGEWPIECQDGGPVDTFIRKHWEYNGTKSPTQTTPDWKWIFPDDPAGSHPVPPEKAPKPHGEFI